jgi:hypothetical protein
MVSWLPHNKSENKLLLTKTQFYCLGEYLWNQNTFG